MILENRVQKSPLKFPRKKNITAFSKRHSTPNIANMLATMGPNLFKYALQFLLNINN
jgi:hypothetical protein